MVSRDRDLRMDVCSTSYLVRVSQFPVETALSHVTGHHLYKVTQALQGKGSPIFPPLAYLAPRALFFFTHQESQEGKKHHCSSRVIHIIYTIDAAVGVLSPSVSPEAR